MNDCLHAIGDSFAMPSGFWIVRVFLVNSPLFLYSCEDTTVTFSLDGSVPEELWL